MPEAASRSETSPLDPGAGDLEAAMRQAAECDAQGRTEDAERIYRELAERRPEHFPLWVARANRAFRNGDVPEAVRMTERCVMLDPSAAVQWRNLCELRRRTGDAQGAIAAGRRAVELKPADPDALYNLSLAHGDAGQIDGAVAAARRLLEIAPGHARGWNNLGHWLTRSGRSDDAREAFRRAVAIEPKNDKIRRNLILELAAAARRHWGEGQQLQALPLLDEALRLDPENVEALGLRATCRADLGDSAAALADVERALARAPGNAALTLILAVCQIHLGMWKEGWKNYESRFAGAHEVISGRQSFPSPPLPKWTGQGETEGQSILVLCEQGFGDCIQFARFLPLLRQRFARVGLLAPRELLRLMESSFGEEVAAIPRFPLDYAGWDWHTRIMTLAHAFGVEIDTVPRPRAYLRCPAPAVEYWRVRLDHAAKSGLRVGLSWMGRPDHRFNRDRTLEMETLRPLLAVEGVTFVSLQQREANAATKAPPGVAWIDWMPEMEDFASTAALMANLDLVIGIDSVIIHLAGALGIPVWMINRHNSEWRWMAPREDSPWYPTMRIFRQSRRGEWDEAIARVVTELRKMQAERRG